MEREREKETKREKMRPSDRAVTCNGSDAQSPFIIASHSSRPYTETTEMGGWWVAMGTRSKWERFVRVCVCVCEGVNEGNEESRAVSGRGCM